MGKIRDGVWGISIKRHEEEIPVGKELTFNLRIVPYREGLWFVTNEALRKTVQRRPSVKEAFNGKLILKVFEKGQHEGIILSEHYFPLIAQGFPHGHPLLKKKGIASLVELEVIEHLMKEYPNFMIRTDKRPDIGRREQLEKRGVISGKLYTLEEFRQKIVDEVNRGTRKARARRKKAKKEKKAKAKRKPRKNLRSSFLK